MNQDYVDDELGWHIRVRPSEGGLDYAYTNLATGETIEGWAMKEAFLPPREEIARHVAEKNRYAELREAGVLGCQISRRIMEMVALLHERGFESLYLDPVMAPHGMCWRYVIGAMVEGTWLHPDCGFGEGACVRGSICGGHDQEILWAKCTDGLVALADGFLSSYLSLAASARQANAKYVAWYREMLEATGPEGVLIFSCEYGPDHEYAFTLDERKDFRMALPPGFVNRTIY